MHVFYRTWLVLLAVASLAGCAQKLTLVNSLTTNLVNAGQGSLQPKTSFGLNDIVIVYAFVSWPDPEMRGGTHAARWKWFKGSQLVSETHTHVTFGPPPGELWTRRTAAALGPGDYHVETYVDDVLLSTNSFTITSQSASVGDAGVYDARLAAQVCDLKG